MRLESSDPNISLMKYKVRREIAPNTKREPAKSLLAFVLRRNNYVHNACERQEAEEYLQILVCDVSSSTIPSHDNQRLFENA